MFPMGWVSGSRCVVNRYRELAFIIERLISLLVSAHVNKGINWGNKFVVMEVNVFYCIIRGLS